MPHFPGETKRNLTYHLMFSHNYFPKSPRTVVVFNSYMLLMFPNLLNSFSLVKYDDERGGGDTHSFIEQIFNRHLHVVR